MTQTQSENFPLPSKKGDEKTSVLYLNHVSQMSGAEQSLRALLWQFRRAGTDIEPVIALPGGGPFADTLREEAWNVTFAPMRRLHRPQGFIDGVTSLMHVLQTAPFIARLAKQTGANIIHSNSTTAHLVGGLAAERINIPSVWHVRDLVPLAKIAPALASRSTAVIAISYSVAQRLEEDGVPKEKICTIHNGLDPDEWNAANSTGGSNLRETLGIEEDDFVFGCVGQLVPWKNHKAFIEAAASLLQDDNCANARFVIMGGDLWGEQKDYVKELRALVKEYNLQGRFNFVPHQNDAVAALSALDCIVLASHEEPFGRVLIEGMSLRKPVIAFNENGPSEIITHEKDGLLVDPNIEDGLALAMMQVLHESDLRQMLGENGRACVMHKFHIAESAQKIADLYHKIRE
jgi:glycosyltransferase involved in cell wall biosynthesis